MAPNQALERTVTSASHLRWSLRARRSAPSVGRQNQTGHATKDTKQKILQEIIRVANQLNPKPITKLAFQQNSKIPFSNVRYHFGSFNRAVQAAGLKPNPAGIRVSGYKKIEDDELLEDLARLWRENGAPPSEGVVNAQGRWSIQPYRDRWGRLSTALGELRKRQPDIVHTLLDAKTVSVKTSAAVPVVIPETYKPKKRGVLKRPLFGEPLDFRGLRYAPINEQGVVYLFGMVSRELGFLIESIRTDYPDCEGKRCISEDRLKWEHVRIEFEHRSSNFREHAHDPEECDLVVCWVHDWQDCPIEVLELRSQISRLNSR